MSDECTQQNDGWRIRYCVDNHFGWEVDPTTYASCRIDRIEGDKVYLRDAVLHLNKAAIDGATEHAAVVHEAAVNSGNITGEEPCDGCGAAKTVHWPKWFGKYSHWGRWQGKPWLKRWSWNAHAMQFEYRPAKGCGCNIGLKRLVSHLFYHPKWELPQG